MAWPICERFVVSKDGVGEHRTQRHTITSLNERRVEELVQNFNKDVFEQWKAGVQDGVKKNDWADLTAHRTVCFSLNSFDTNLGCCSAILRVSWTS